jgi:hypothetical protein
MTPQQPKGEEASAHAKIQVAIRLLEEQLVALGSTSKSGKAVMKALHTLASEFGQSEDKAQAIMPAELKSALLAPAGGEAGPPGGGAAPPPGGAGAGAPAAMAA